MNADIDPAAAARFGLMLEAARRGDLVRAAEMLLSIGEADLRGINARLAAHGINPRDLIDTVMPGVRV